MTKGFYPELYHSYSIKASLKSEAFNPTLNESKIFLTSTFMVGK
jgi:hypothetical protein